ncbi:MAG: ubiquinol oxidase subunit II [Pseudomonadota bacterium]
MKLISSVSLIAGAVILGGCDLVVMRPSGDVAAQQADLIVYATVLMLIVIVPVILLTIFFAFYYRSSNTKARYEPDWDHSISLEIVIWAVPLAIIICLAGLTWVATHRLNPYDPLRRISETQPIDPTVEPMTVYVTAMDWKWMFIYPEQGIATVNEAAVIKDRPIEWKITSTTVMNSFYVPAMAGMIYGMAGMETELNAVMNETGTFDGISGTYSGAGFSYMTFKLHSFEEAGFDEWVAKVQSESTGELTREAVQELDKPTIDHPVTYYSPVADGVWDRILNMCIGEDALCQNDMMMVDALGGGGLDGLWNREAFLGICAADDPELFLALVRPDMRDKGDQILQTAFNLLPDTTPKSVSTAQ